MKILDGSTVTLDEGRAWAEANGADPRFVAVAWHYWNTAPRYGIPPEIPYAQAAKETNWGKYTGVVPAGFHNWCGLKTSKGGSNSDPKAHQRFPDDATGVLAHVQHLARYAGAEALPEGDELVDPRWHLVTGFTETVEGLGGPDSWAPDPGYGRDVAKRVMGLRDFARNMPDPIPGGPMGAYEHVIPGLVDLRPELQRNPRGGSEGRLALREKRGLVVHFNGPDVGANDRQNIINVAAYHCTKDFSRAGDGSAIGDGIMYHVAVADDGTAYLLRDLEAGLWHCGHAWNRHSLSVYVPIGINQRATDVQLRRLAEVTDDWQRFTGEGREAVKGHMELSATNCPGSLMADFVRPYRAGAFSGGEPLPPVVEPVPAVPGAQLDPWRFDEAARNYAAKWNGGEPFWVLDPFVDWIHQHGGLMAIGYAVSGAFFEDGLLVQYFEGGRLEWHPGNPSEHRVLRGHTGLEVLRDRHPERVPA